MALEESLSPFERLGARHTQSSDANIVDMWLRSGGAVGTGRGVHAGPPEAARANEILRRDTGVPIRRVVHLGRTLPLFRTCLELQMQTRRWSAATLPGKVSDATSQQRD